MNESYWDFASILSYHHFIIYFSLERSSCTRKTEIQQFFSLWRYHKCTNVHTYVNHQSLDRLEYIQFSLSSQSECSSKASILYKSNNSTNVYL